MTKGVKDLFAEIVNRAHGEGLKWDHRGGSREVWPFFRGFSCQQYLMMQISVECEVKGQGWLAARFEQVLPLVPEMENGGGLASGSMDSDDVVQTCLNHLSGWQVNRI